MSKENAKQFMTALENDLDLKSRYDGITEQLKKEDQTIAAWKKAILEKVIPFAKENGYDFSLDDLKNLQNTARDELSDEDLEQISGGRGVYGSYYCDMVSDDRMFAIFVEYGSLAGCPDWQGANGYSRSCRFCVNYKHV